MIGLGVWSRLREKISPGFRFDRPLLLLQSDDWGRVGVRDEAGREELRAAGINLGERPYDLYSLETAADVNELAGVLGGSRDSVGQSACLEMNFVTANVDFVASAVAGHREIALKPLAEGLPGRWARPGLNDAYRAGIDSGVFAPALHGTTHFCQSAVTRVLTSESATGEMLRTLWKSETPYIYWRMPCVGYEYWDPGQRSAKGFISSAEQQRWIEWACHAYREMFGEDAVSACAPGYRADWTTHRAWKKQGIRIVQNGPGSTRPPHRDELGLLHLSRAVDFEAGVDPDLRWEDCVKDAARWLDHGLPYIVSIHSINFHSTLAPYKQKALPALRDLLAALQKNYPDLLYINSRQLLEIVETGSYQSGSSRVSVNVTGAVQRVRA